MKTQLIDLMIDRNLRLQILDKKVTDLLKSNKSTEDKISIWKIKIAEITNRIYRQDLNLVRKLSSRYRKSHCRN